MKNDRLGLLMIAATLAVIAMTVALYVGRQASVQERQIRSQGIGLARALSSLPFEQLAPQAGRPGLLQTLLGIQRSPDFAYGVLVSATGARLAEVVAPTTLVPDAPLPTEPAAWVGEAQLRTPGDGRPVREFYGPVMSNGNLAGFVRLGYYASPGWLSLEQVSFSALLALPIFLLTTLFYFLMRREMKPLAALSAQMQTIGKGEPPPADPENVQVSDFVERFGRFLQVAEARIRELEVERSHSVTANRLLAYRKDKVEAMLHALPEAVVVIDEACNASFANAKLEPLLGARPEEVIGRPPQAWCRHPEVLEFLLQHQSEAGQGSRAAQTQVVIDAGGSRRHLMIASYPLFSPQDRSTVLGMLVVFRDSTQEQLARNAGAEFVSSVSHELKTPLATVASYSELLMDGSEVDESMRIEAVNVIHDEVERMNSLIGNLLNISKLETGALAVERQRVNLRDLLHDAFESLRQNALGRGIEFRIDVPPNLGLLAIDKDLFRIALNNLLSNAIKYNVDGGRVTLSAEEDGENGIEIRVRDTGIGIAAEHLEHVFDKYYRVADQASASRSGHGLGLHLAKQIVEMHHGSIRVTSVPGKGTEFCIQMSKQTAPYREALAA